MASTTPLYLIPLFLLLVIACYTDLAWKKVYNWTTIPGILVGFLLHLAFDSWQGFVGSVLGCLLGFVLFGLLYLIGGMGAGDVKLAGAIGSLGGFSLACWAALYTAYVGGFMAIGLLLWQTKTRTNALSGLKSILRFKRPAASENAPATDIPYAVAMVIGTFAAVARELYVHGISSDRLVG